LIGRNKAPDQVLRNHADVFLQSRDIRTAGLSASQRRNVSSDQDIADAGLGLDHRVHVGDRLQRLRRVQRRALGKFDQDIDRICARQLGVEAPARRDRLPLVGHLIGQPIARLQIGVDDGQTADKTPVRSG